MRQHTIITLAAAGLLAGCGASTDVTARSIREARQLWTRAGLRDYDLEWTSTGLRSGHYLVFVREGHVRQVRSILADGRTIVAKPGDPSFYSVDGLFQVLEEELDQAQSERPFGQPPGTRIILKFDPDPKLGYPRQYRRDVAGSPQGLAIDVLRLEPSPSPGLPPLPDAAP
jgi:hypothetical protein